VPGRSPRQERSPEDPWALRRYPAKVRGTILPVTDLRSRLAHMRVAVTATAATPPRHATLTRPARRLPWPPPGTPCPAPPDCPGARHPGGQGRLRRRCASAARPCDPGLRARDLAAITATGQTGTPPHPHGNQARPSDNDTNQAQEQQKLDGPLHMGSWPFGVALRREAPNHLMLRWLKTVVVSDEEKAS